MSILAIRHSLSEANNRNNIGTLAFGHKDAPLMEDGRRLVREKLKPELRDKYSVTLGSTAVAVSQLLRTRQTAEVAGFPKRLTTPYASLNEVEHGMEGPALRTLLDSGGLPDAALRAAEAILDSPPSEGIWISHGLVIAGLCKVLGVGQQYERLVPRFCEVRELPIDIG